MKVVQKVKYGARGQGRLVRFDESRFWYSCYYAGGKEYRESTETDDFKKAKAFHKQKLDEVAAARHSGKKFLTPTDRRRRVGELLDSLVKDFERRGKASPQFGAHLKPIRGYFGDWLVVKPDR